MFVQRLASLKYIAPLFALLLLVGCSDEKTYSTEGGDVTVKRNGSDIEITGESDEGNKFTAQSGKNVEIPADFPSDIPIYKGAKPLVVMQMDAQGQSVTLESGDSLDTVYQFYVDALQANGWTLEAQMDWGSQKMISATKGDHQTAVSIGSTDGKTQIVLTHSTNQ